MSHLYVFFPPRRDPIARVTYHKGSYHLTYSEHNPVPVSLSLPLTTKNPSSTKVKRWLQGYLPTEPSDRIALALQRDLPTPTSRSTRPLSNPRALLTQLEAVGFDVAGAFVFSSSPTLPVPTSTYPQRVSVEFEVTAKYRSTSPLRVGLPGARLSLAGYQPKFSVHADPSGSGFFVPSITRPSTHIVKPENPAYPAVASLEHEFLSLARTLGIRTSESSYRKTLGNATPYLVSTRFDRALSTQGISRLRAEDMLQALGLDESHMYRNHWRSVVRLIRSVGGESEVEVFLSQLLFNLLIGNADAHLKNYSFLTHFNRVSPLYDVVPTVLYPDVSRNLPVVFDSPHKAGSALRYSDFQSLATKLSVSPDWVCSEVSRQVSFLKNEVPSPIKGIYTYL